MARQLEVIVLALGVGMLVSCNADDDSAGGTGTDSASGDDGSGTGDDGSDDGGSDDGGSGDGGSGDGGSGGGSSGTDDDGSGDAGTSGTESTGTGGSGTATGCDAADGEPDADDCTDAAAPFCVGGECVDCSEVPVPNESCAALEGSADYCDMGEDECVDCLMDDHCDTPTAARCDQTSHTCAPCETNPDCSNITDLNVCNDGTCVECTPTYDSACSGNVCHAIDFICTNDAPGSAGLCEECVADAHCGTDQLCILMDFDSQDVGYFCLWRQDAPAGPNGSCNAVAPFSDDTSTTSIEGTSTNVCGLVTTTCPALTDYVGAQTCGGPGTGDDDCGVVGLDDGLCRDSGGTDFCTIPCVTALHCPGVTCVVSSPNYCAFS